MFGNEVYRDFCLFVFRLGTLDSDVSLPTDAVVPRGCKWSQTGMDLLPQGLGLLQLLHKLGVRGEFVSLLHVGTAGMGRGELGWSLPRHLPPPLV